MQCRYDFILSRSHDRIIACTSSRKKAGQFHEVERGDTYCDPSEYRTQPVYTYFVVIHPSTITTAGRPMMRRTSTSRSSSHYFIRQHFFLSCSCPIKICAWRLSRSHHPQKATLGQTLTFRKYQQMFCVLCT